MGIAQLGLLLLQLVEAGFELKAIVLKTQDMMRKGATDEQITKYLSDLADLEIATLKSL